MSGAEKTLARLRADIDEVDGKLIELAAKRQALVAEIGRRKRARRQPTRDYTREREVHELARSRAQARGLDPDLAQHLLDTLIRASLTSQERDRLEASATGAGRRALVIGGAGRMGRWFVDYLGTQGWGVEISDPAGPVAELAWHEDWREPAGRADLIVVAAPLAATARILEELAELAPAGLVMEIGSIKAPVAPALTRLVDAGVRVASIHPMFGPDTRLLSGRHVILVDAGDPEGLAEARRLFESTSASLAEMSLEAHDRLVAWVLGLSHATNIAFFSALEACGQPVSELAKYASTTFSAQLDVASRVASENPDLYFEIQSLNPHGREPLQALADAAAEILRTVGEGEGEAFSGLMGSGARYLAGSPDKGSR
ncbi:MAG: prephenate dehydrogenase/arogenate dehydrogenase family protein [Gammaproteobacteria bacterium]